MGYGKPLVDYKAVFNYSSYQFTVQIPFSAQRRRSSLPYQTGGRILVAVNVRMKVDKAGRYQIILSIQSRVSVYIRFGDAYNFTVPDADVAVDYTITDNINDLSSGYDEVILFSRNAFIFISTV